MERLNPFVEIYDILLFSRFSIFIAKITIDFHYFNLFRFYGKYFNIILSFFSYSLGEKKYLYSDKPYLLT